MSTENDYELSPDFIDAGWDTLDLEDAFTVIGDLIDYMDEQGYM